jgi:hypothetical protein
MRGKIVVKIEHVGWGKNSGMRGGSGWRREGSGGGWRVDGDSCRQGWRSGCRRLKSRIGDGVVEFDKDRTVVGSFNVGEDISRLDPRQETRGDEDIVESSPVIWCSGVNLGVPAWQDDKSSTMRKFTERGVDIDGFERREEGRRTGVHHLPVGMGFSDNVGKDASRWGVKERIEPPSSL